MTNIVRPEGCTDRRQVLRQIEKIRAGRTGREGIERPDPLEWERYKRLLVGYDKRLRELRELGG